VYLALALPTNSTKEAQKSLFCYFYHSKQNFRLLPNAPRSIREDARSHLQSFLLRRLGRSTLVSYSVNCWKIRCQ
jgi:hypothetical protein